MIRRSRISVRPNIKPAGRALTGSRDASQDKTQPDQNLLDSAPSQGSKVTAEQVNTGPPAAALETTDEKAAHEEDATSKCADSQAPTSTSSTSGPQRRKRMTALPNLAKPRAAPASSRTPKSPSQSPVKQPTPSESEKPSIVVESAPRIVLAREPVPKAKIPERHGTGRLTKAQPTPAAPSQIDLENASKGGGASEHQHPLKTSQPDPVILHETIPECNILPASGDTIVQPEDSSKKDKEKDWDFLKEKLKSSSKVIKSLNDPADIIRLAKARKLRELLKLEMSKTKEDKKKPRLGVKERMSPKDHTKMTMRDLIYYLPDSNPMKSFTEEEEKATEIVLPNSPKPTYSKPPTGPAVQENADGDGVHEDEEEAEMAEGTPAEREEPLLVPRVKVAEDGSLIIDEESLTVQVSRMNGPNPAEDRDPIFERGSTTTYSSFRKGNYTKPWSNGETDMFYMAISMVGTDFSMIGQLFPHRARVEIKNKFKKEERMNSWRIDKAFKEKRRLDLDFFRTVMEQILKAERTKKVKNKELVKLAKVQKTHRKPKVVKRMVQKSPEASDSDEVAGEKENEDLWNEEGSEADAKKRRGGEDQSHIRTANDQADIQNCEDEVSEALLSDDSRSKESDSKRLAIKPAQLKGRPQRPTPTLSNRCRNMLTGAETKKTPKVTPVPVLDREKKQSAIRFEDLEEEPDLTAVQEKIFNKPTRSGRIPKLSQHVMQAAAEEEEDEEEPSVPPLSSKDSSQGFRAPSRKHKGKPGPCLKQGMTRRGKSRLVTLRASGTEDDDDEEEVEDYGMSQEDFSSNPEEENQPFVPMSLRSLQADVSEVVETVEELDISVNVPDILGTSQNALCPELSCEQAEIPAGCVPCEHQLDLLVDVIEFLDPDHMEVCEEINTEAAQTLLTIGNSAQTFQTTEISCTGDNEIGEQSINVVPEEVVQEVLTETVEHQTDTSVVMSGLSVSDKLETKGAPKVSSIGNNTPQPAAEETYIMTEQPITIQTTNDVPTQDELQNLGPSTSVPPSRRGRFSKSKPNVGQVLRPRRAQQQQASQEPDSVQNSSGQNHTEQDKNTKEPMPKDLGPSPKDSSTILMQMNTLSERRDGTNAIPEKVVEKDGSVSSLKRKYDDVITEESAKKYRREPKDEVPETQLTKSVSVSYEESDKSCKVVRRTRAPKPKPNLTSRLKHTQTPQNKTVPVAESSTSTLTSSELPECSTVVTTGSHDSQSEPVMEIKDVSTQVVSEDEKPKAVALLEENIRGTSGGNNPGELPVCLLQDTSADPTHDEPVFVLSLTEIPPTSHEGSGFETESQSQSAIESREACHLLITDALVPISEADQKGKGNEDKASKGELQHKAFTSRSPKIAKKETQTEHHEMPVAKRTEEVKECLVKKRELPGRASRPKLQVKPNPVSRSRQGTSAKMEMATLSLEENTSAPISELNSQEILPLLKEKVPASIPTTVNSDRLTSAVSSEGETTCSSRNIPALRQDLCQDITASDLVRGQKDPAGKDAVELVDTEGCWSQLQDVSQTASVATSVPLMRPGRRPKGFLSFMSTKSTQGPSGTHRGAKPGPQKPAVNTSRAERKRVATIPVTTTKRPEAKPYSTNTSNTELNSEEEPTSVSKYFFSDIFTEVDELEDMD